jgi:hypothetical protein
VRNGDRQQSDRNQEQPNDFLFHKISSSEVAVRVENAGKVVEEIEIQVAGGNLLRIRSTRRFRAAVLRNNAYISIAEFCVFGKVHLHSRRKFIVGETIFCGETTVTQMETARNLRIEFRARNL